MAETDRRTLLRPAGLAGAAGAALAGAMHGKFSLAPVTAAQAQTATGRNGMVATQEALATRVGVDILSRGGNAVDAAVAVGFALAVTHPTAGNIGGGGFMVFRSASGDATTFDFREMAPAGSNPII